MLCFCAPFVKDLACVAQRGRAVSHWGQRARCRSNAGKIRHFTLKAIACALFSASATGCIYRNIWNKPPLHCFSPFRLSAPTNDIILVLVSATHKSTQLAGLWEFAWGKSKSFYFALTQPSWKQKNLSLLTMQHGIESGCKTSLCPVAISVPHFLKDHEHRADVSRSWLQWLNLFGTWLEFGQWEESKMTKKVDTGLFRAGWLNFNFSFARLQRCLAISWAVILWLVCSILQAWRWNLGRHTWVCRCFPAPAQ